MPPPILPFERPVSAGEVLDAGVRLFKVSLLFYHPFEVGDRVQLSAPTGLETGVVDEMTMGYILVKTVDDRHIVVPNSVAAQQIVVKLRAS